MLSPAPPAPRANEAVPDWSPPASRLLSVPIAVRFAKPATREPRRTEFPWVGTLRPQTPARADQWSHPAAEGPAPDRMSPAAAPPKKPRKDPALLRPQPAARFPSGTAATAAPGRRPGPPAPLFPGCERWPAPTAGWPDWRRR